MRFTLHAIASSHAQQLPIETLSADPARASTVEFMVDGGYRNYVASDADIRNMMRQAIDSSLARSNIRPDRIEAILLSTESFWDSGLGETSHRSIPPSERLREMLCEEIAHAGLVNAMPFGNWMSACSNFGSTLALGSALLESGDIVASWRYSPTGRLKRNRASCAMAARFTAMSRRPASLRRMPAATGSGISSAIRDWRCCVFRKA